MLKEAKDALEKAVSLDNENQLYKNNLKLVDDAIAAANASQARTFKVRFDTSGKWTFFRVLALKYQVDFRGLGTGRSSPDCHAGWIFQSCSLLHT